MKIILDFCLTLSIAIMQKLVLPMEYPALLDMFHLLLQLTYVVQKIIMIFLILQMQWR